MPTKDVALDEIRIDGGTQPRALLNQGIVDLYAEEPEKLPPGRAVFDGSVHWLWDGFHRYFALRQADAPTMALEVTKGTQEDARWLAAGANKDHAPAGLRRTNDDKRNAVRMALEIKPDLSDRAIAEHVGVSDKTVAAVRHAYEDLPRAEFPHVGEQPRRIGADDKSYPAHRQPQRRPADLPPSQPITPLEQGIYCDRCKRLMGQDGKGSPARDCLQCDEARRTSMAPKGVGTRYTLAANPPEQAGSDGSTPQDHAAAILQALKDHQDAEKLPASSYAAAVKAVRFWLSGKEVKGFVKPTLEEVAAYCRERKNKVDPEAWMAYYTANGWMVGKNPMKDWHAAVITWEKNNFQPQNGKAKPFQGLKDFVDEMEGRQ